MQKNRQFDLALGGGIIQTEFLAPKTSIPKFADMSSSRTVEEIQRLIASAFVVVFSKSWCPFCDRVKQLFRSLGVSFKVIELDQEKNGKGLFRPPK